MLDKTKAICYNIVGRFCRIRDDLVEERRMRMGYYQRRRKRRRGLTVLLLLFLVSVFLVSCVAGNNSLWVRRLFGADLRAYRAETVLTQHLVDSDLSRDLCSSVEVLATGSVELDAFDSPSDAVRLYRDELLNALMRDNYSQYLGNPTLCRSVSEQYPHLNASVMIPASDFENAAIRYLGASSVSNRDGERFSYLSRSSCYLAPTQARSLSVTCTPLALEETASTYRLSFSLTDEDGNTASYLALFVKRTEGSAYIRSLEVI